MSYTPRGRAGGGGRGRGGARVNHTAVSMDYNAEPIARAAYTPSIPKPVINYSPNPTQSSGQSTPSRSGYNTPKTGIAFNQSTRGSNGSSRGTRGGRSGRGGSGGLGYGDRSLNSMMNGVDRPFLVPVAFVKASALPIELGLEGDEEPIVVETAGELDDQIMNGGLIEIVRELDLEESSDEEEDQEEENADDSILGNTQQDTSIDFNQLFVSDTTPSLPSEILSISTSTSTFVLGLASTAEDTPMDSDSDSDSEEIVFIPTGRPSIAPKPVLPPTAAVEAPVLATISTPVIDSISTSLPPSPQEPEARPKALTKNQKRQLKKEGKKARKSGKTHTRSGNQHLFADAPPDSSEEEHGMNVGDGIEESKAREGDSDLDWGDAPPPPETGALRPRGTNRKERRKLERAQAQESARVERLSTGARHQVAFVLREDVEDKDFNSIPLVARSKPRGRNQLTEEERDYAENVYGLKKEGNDSTSASEMDGEDLIASMGFLLRGDKNQVTIDELDDEARAEEEDVGEGWRTTSGEESDTSDGDADSDDELEMDIALGEADAAVELAIQAAEDAELDISGSDLSSSDEEESSRLIEEALLSGNTVRFSSMGVAGAGGRRGRKEKKTAKKGKGRYVESDSDDSSDDDAMFEGNETWADNDEDYIRGLQDILDENSDILKRGNRKSRNKLFKAVQNGNFDDYDFEEDYNFASGSSKKGKGKTSGAFSDSLQKQWEQDRSKKGEYKKNRALARAEAQEAAPWLAKKSAKSPSSRSANSSDVVTINIQIREFLLHQVGKTSLSLPPMSKKSRIAVHLLAEVYGLKSRSLGKGQARFPVLERSSKSSINVDERRIKAILSTAESEPRGAYGKGSNAGSAKARGKMGGLWAALSGDSKSNGGYKSGGRSGGGGGGPTTREGAVVGQGADKLGEGNVGYELLKRMGWTAGTLIGNAGGIEEPIVARLKVGKSGLGSGYAVSRPEAQNMGRRGY